MAVNSELSTSFSLFDTLVLGFLRIGLVLFCQYFVLGILREQIKTGSEDNNIELDTLPRPSSAPGRSKQDSSTTKLHFVSRTIFSLCFSESCMLFVLLMCQALDGFSPSSRLLHWKLSLYALLSLLLFVIPMALSLITTSSYLFKCLPGPSRILPLIGYFALLSYVPLPGALAKVADETWLGSTFSRLIVLGVVLLGALSGYGSVTTSWGYFPFLCGSSQKLVTSTQVEEMKHSLARVQSEIARKREELMLAHRKQDVNGTKQTSWVSRMTPTFRGESELSVLKTELSTLEALEHNMASDLLRLQERHAAITFDSTFTGAAYILLRRAIGIYCLFRVISSILNFVLPSSPSASSPVSYPDLLTSFITSLIHFLPLSPSTLSTAQTRIPTFLRQVNLVVVGAIIFSSLRRVLVALRIVGRSRGAGASRLLVLAQIMGVYFISTLVQLRTSFPPSESDASSLFATLPEYQLFGSIFDTSFVIAVILASITEWLRGKGEDNDE